MEVTINQVILHLLDPGASEPMLSDRPMEMDADLFEYFTAVLEKAFASDEVKNCRFLPDSAFAAEMAHNNDFVDLSRRIAGVIFEQMLQYPRPSRRAIWPWWISPPARVPPLRRAEAELPPRLHPPHPAAGQRAGSAAWCPQRTLLPGTPKADEAALIDRANGAVRLIEKKFTHGRQKGLLPVHPRVRLHRGHAGEGQAEGRLRDRRRRREGGLPRDRTTWTMCRPLTAAPRPPWSCWCATRPWTTRSPSRTCASRIRENFPLAAPKFEEALAETGVRERRPRDP